VEGGKWGEKEVRKKGGRQQGRKRKEGTDFS
jgi:hypothetical protein